MRLEGGQWHGWAVLVTSGTSLEGRQARLEGGQWQEWATRDLVTSGISLEVSMVSGPAQ